MHMQKHLYLDHAAATPLRAEVLEAMLPYLRDQYANPSSTHSMGREAREAVEQARERIAAILHCSPEEVVFTGSGTESDALAIKGVARGHVGQNRLITSQIEHPAVLNSHEELAKEGFETTYVSVSSDGLVDPHSVGKLLSKEVSIVSVMYANNEIGTIQPIKEIAQLAHQHGALMHTDACQAAGALSINVKELGVDLLTLNGSKIYGPKGVGVLYIKQGVELQPLFSGGGQERGLRGGTENVASIIGLATALELAEKDRESENARLTALRDQLMAGLLHIEGTTVNGHQSKRLPNNINISFKGLDASSIIEAFDQKGILCSSTSACAAENQDPSHVLLALGRTYKEAFESVRLTLGRDTTNEDIQFTIKTATEIVARLRRS